MSDVVDRRPPLDAVAAAVLAASLVVIVLLGADGTAALAAALALPGLALAGLLGSHRLLAVGVGALVLAIAIAGVAGASPATLVAAAVLSVTAWDVLHHGFSLGTHVGRSATTRRSVLVHGGATLLVGTVLAGATLGGLAVLPAGRPVSAVVFALLAGLFALLALE